MKKLTKSQEVYMFDELLADYWYNRFLMADKRAKKWRKAFEYERRALKGSVIMFNNADLKRVGWKILFKVTLILGLLSWLVK